MRLSLLSSGALLFTLACNLNGNNNVATSKKLTDSAEVLIEHGKLKTAENVLTKAIELDRDNAVAYNDVAICKFRENAPSDTVMYYIEKAKSKGPHLIAPYLNLADMYFKNNDFKNAISEAEKCIKIIDTNDLTEIQLLSETYDIAGKASNELEHFDSAIFYLKKAIEYNHNNYSAYRAISYSYVRTSKYTEAIKAATKAIEEDSLNSGRAVYCNRGICFNAIGQYDLALKDYNKAIEIAPKTPEYFLNRGTLYMEMNEKDKAFSDFKKAELLGGPKAINYFNETQKWLNSPSRK